MIKKKKNSLHHLAMTFLVLLLMVLMLPAQAQARGLIDTGRDVSLTLDYKFEDLPMRNLAAGIYYVATIDAMGEFQLTGDFKDYAVKVFPIMEMEEWGEAAEALTGYAIADNLTPLHNVKTSASGLIEIPDMAQGLYLVMSDQHVQEGWIYSVAPFLVALPDAEVDGEWVYDVLAFPKIERLAPSYEDVEHRVVKYWVDEGNEAHRPSGIQVDIYRDKTLVYTESLNPSNNWSFSWIAPDDGSVWRVVEKNVPAPYKVSLVNNSDGSFGIYNTWEEGGKPPVTGEPMPLLMWSVFLVLTGLFLAFVGWRLRRTKAGQ